MLVLSALACGGPAATQAPAAPVAAPTSAGDAEGAEDDFDPHSELFLSSIPARVSDRAAELVVASASDAELARRLRVRVQVMQGYSDLGELTRRSKLPLVNGTFQISDLSKLGSRDTPTKRDQASSFVVDFDEASFATPIAELEKSGKARSPAGISSFADRYISDKTYARSFDVASRVAETHAGDCTEHAVFATALLRRFGFKARVVFGIVLAGFSGPELRPRILAFGHAWVERHDKQGWHILDAALGGPDREGDAELSGMRDLPKGTKMRLVYLPITVLKDESASYGRALMDHVGVESVLGVEVDVNQVSR
jgi:hypothetical protein